MQSQTAPRQIRFALVTFDWRIDPAFLRPGRMFMRSRIFLPALLALLACSERAAETVLPEPTPCEIDGVRNCVLADDLLIAGQPSEEGLQRLAELGYTTIISTRGAGEVDWDERAAVEGLGMAFVNIPMNNPVTEITDEQVAALAEALANADGPTVLHCGSGNRASGLWAAWLVEREGVAPEVALRLAEQTGMTGVRAVTEQRLGVGEARQP